MTAEVGNGDVVITCCSVGTVGSVGFDLFELRIPTGARGTSTTSNSHPNNPRDWNQ